MKIISLGMGQKIFEENSSVRQRQIEYGKFFDILHLIVFTPNDDRFQVQKLSNNVFLYPTKSKIRLFYFFDFFKIIRRILKNTDKRDFILTCQDPFETGLSGVFIKLFFNLPLHIQIHTDLSHKYFRESSFLNKVRFLMFEFILKYSDRVRVVSERIKKSIESFSNNIDVLPIKADIKESIGEEIKKPFPFTLIMVCRLEKEKNIETVLKVIKNLNNNDIGLCLIGDGSEKNNLQKISRDLGLSERVYFAGWQNNLASYYKMADAFVSTSLYEGYGVSTIEAAYFGLPLILSQTGVSGDIFKNDSAFICDAKDERCFAQSILKIYEDRNMAHKMGERAKGSAQKHLATLDDYFRKYVDSVLKTAENFKKRNWFSRLIEFKKTIFNSFIALRYFICGITAAATNIGSLYLFTDVFDIWYLYSSIMSFLLSLFISFYLQKFVVFKDMGTDKIHHQFSRFFVAAVLGVTINTAIIFFCVDILGIWYIFSQIVAGFFVMIQNFLLYKFFIFNRK